MKKRLIFVSVLLCCITIFSVKSAMAFGIGAYVDGAYNKFSVSGDGGSADIGDYGFLGAGLVLDTCLARNQLFNYRLQLGYQKDLKYPDFGTHKISMNNYFGFGLVRMQYFRWWMGPQIGIRYYILEGDESSTSEAGGNVGLVMGFNFNIGKVFTIGLDFGFRYNFLFRDPLFHGPEAHGALAFMFRVDDNYSAN